MKNLFLFLILSTLTLFAYFSNLEDSLLFENSDEIQFIKTNNYSLKSESAWLFEGSKLKEEFINTFLKVLSSIEIESKAQYKGKVFGSMSVFYKSESFILELGEKLFSDNGLYLKINKRWFIVKNTFSEGIVYKDNNDLALKQYDIIYNLFTFSKEVILKNTVNKP